MAKTFQELQASRAERFDNLTAKINSKGGFQAPAEDPNEWKPTRDPKTGNGSAVIRFLPQAPENNDEYVTVYSYSFKQNGKWYIEKSLSTLFAQGFKDTPRRRTDIWANILVINDPAKPEWNGRVAKFRYGTKIQSMITDCTNPTDPTETRFNPFDFDDGANFRLKITTVSSTDPVTQKKTDFPNYDKSKFESPSPLFAGDKNRVEKLEAIWNSEHDLRPLIDPANFKTYDELKKRLLQVVGEEDSLSDLVEKASSKNTKVSKPEEDFELPADVETSGEELPWFTDLEKDDD